MRFCLSVPDELPSAVAARISDLESFIDAQLSKAWAWGSVDCSMMVADWVMRRTGMDPAKDFRGQYHDAETCHALIQVEGGFMPIVGFAMDSLGFERTLNPQAGDVGIVNVPVALLGRLPAVQAVSAIRYHGDAWAVRGLNGIDFRPHPLVTAWTVR